MAGEIALRLDRARIEMDILEHIPGLLNFVADALSRLEAGKQLPAILTEARRDSAPARTANFWMAWPSEW